MAWRYRKVPVVSGEVVHPDSWTQNHMDYAGEFNGRLDRDNLPSNVGVSQQPGNYTEPWITRNFRVNCFHEIRSDGFGSDISDRFYFRNSFAGWASKQSDMDAKGSTNRIGEINYTSEHEGLVMVHWSGWLVGEPERDPATGGDETGLNDYYKNDDFYKRKAKFANFRILVNGTEVANSGKHSAAWVNQCVSMTGASPVEAGEVTITVQGRAGLFKDLEFDMQAFEKDRAIFALRSRELVVIFKKR